jgi:hypothetical protein
MISLAELQQTLAAHRGHVLQFVLPDGGLIEEHFHITEVGHVTKDFMDCGGTRRTSSACVLQTLVAHDVDHRLSSDKFADVLRRTALVVPDDALPVEIEYDQGTVAQYAVAGATVEGGAILFSLEAKHTACLAPDKCGLAEPDSANADNQPEAACDPAGNC